MNLGIVGAGELAHEIFELVSRSEEKWENIFFIDKKECCGDKVLFSDEEFFNNEISKDTEVLIAVGEPALRKEIFVKYRKNNIKLATYVDKRSFVSNTCKIGKGTIIFPFCYVSHDTEIGENTLMHTSVTIENNCTVKDNCFLSVNSFTGAYTYIGSNCFIGPGAVLRDKIVIEENNIIGMGGVVTKNCEPSGVYIGNPAKRVRDNKNEKIFN